LVEAIGLDPEDLIGMRVKNPTVTKEDVKQRNITLDILLETKSQGIIHVEIQVIEHAHITHRIVYQHARLATEQHKVGEKSWLLKKQISIVIMNFNLSNGSDDNAPFLRKFLWRDNQGKVFTDISEINTIELPRVSLNPESSKTDWFELFKARNEEDFKKIAQKSDVMNKAVERLKYFSADEEVRELAMAHDDYLRTENDLKALGQQLLIQVFKMLRQKSSDTEIKNTLNISDHELEVFKMEFLEIFG
jgi:predicted transposase/invertase (TIGR01784 family)